MRSSLRPLSTNAGGGKERVMRRVLRQYSATDIYVVLALVVALLTAAFAERKFAARLVGDGDEMGRVRLTNRPQTPEAGPR